MSFMEDEDDDFGDLYTDVLLPFTTPSSSSQPPQQPPPPQPLSSDLSNDGDKKSYGGSSNPKLSIPSETLVSDRNHGGENFVTEEEVVTRVSPKADASRVLDFGVSVKSEPFVSSEIGDDVRVDGDDDESGSVAGAGGELKIERMDMDDGDGDGQPMIPGLSSSSSQFNPPAAAAPRVFQDEEEEGEPMDASKREEDEWDSDSDSEDDLKIVLNEDEHDGMNGKEHEGEEDEDGQDLVIVAGDDQIHQLGDQQELGEDGTKQMGDGGERKEIGEGGPKALNGGVMMPNAGGVRPMYPNQGFHPHHSQFKYVRPGAAMVPGGGNVGPGGLQNQVRPLGNMGTVPGAGRGDWRPMGVKGGPPMQKGFQPGFGFPGQFGRGPEFTLPSHKTVFDIDIDGIEEKTWRNPGVDISDFFNFGLNEEAWKDYCKQLGQLRLEATMQSKIRVYESGRSVQDYDPDLPPELALAAGGQDTVENLNPGKIDGGQGDSTGQGRGAAHARPMMPPGRAIQVEGGYGERLPSAETRPQRARDTDSVIEIVLQGSVDDDLSTDNGNDEQLGVQGEDLKGDHEIEEDMAEQPDNESYEGDGTLPFPSEAAPIHYRPGSKGHNPVYPPGAFGLHHEGRRSQGDVRVNSNHAAVGSKSYDTSKGKSSRSSDGNQTPESSSHVQVDGVRGSVSEHKDDLHNELATADSSVRIDEDEMSRDVTLTNDASGDGQVISKADQPAVMDIDEGYDLMPTRSSDNSRARSGGSRDYQKKRETGEEEVVQEARSRRMGEMRRRRDEDENSFRKRGSTDRDGRLDVGRNLMPVKVREDSHHPSRESYPNPAHQLHPKTTDFEMRRDSSSAGARQRRDDETHVRRVRDEETRKRERVEEIGSRHGSKARESESNEREEHHHHSRKRLENSEWRGRPEKIVGHSQRDRDDYMMNRLEILNDPPTKRRKDEEYPRREQAEKEEYLHGFRTREGSSRRNREPDDFMEHRRDDRLRLREKLDDPHFLRHRDESWRLRERDEWQRLKQPHEDIFPNREREEIRGSVRSSRGTEDKHMMGNARIKDESRVVGFEKDYPFKDKKRLNEQSKRREREEDATLLQHRGREDVFASENYTHNEDRNPRHERSSKNGDHSVDNRQWSNKERPKDISRSKESEPGDQNTVARSKRKQEESSAHRYVKVGKGASEQESGSIPTESRASGQSRTVSSSLSKKNHKELEPPVQHNSRNHRQDASSDDERQSSRRRVSKQDSSLNEKERTRSTNTKTKEANKKNNKSDTASLATDQPDELVKKVETGDNQHPPNEEKAAGDSERNGDDRSHLDTVAKLKKRSERFKLPLTSEKDATGNLKTDAEVVTTHNETVADEAGIKPERPARKRRWTGS
ncbi:hypothetical protein MKW98_014151 [Papaver atlanticum]|uniref:Pre-mRNA polyadenylation factor Fip1 domain-containing protein n=1 Tax=Papaver atlanticum TaxID=357466 RepID=A0AAD4SKK7_9MAGN|nr:hypothetical protein MKW98_014151 [Papaver atlanticum]